MTITVKTASEAKAAPKNTMPKPQWVRVNMPQAWYPQKVGDTLVGTYGGRTLKKGENGQYEVILIRTAGGVFTVTGVRVIQLIDGSGSDVGDPVKVVFLGLVELPNGRKMKNFDVFVDKAAVMDKLVVASETEVADVQ